MLRAGLGVLARSYRDRMSDALGQPGPSAAARVRGCQAAVELITEAAAALQRNPNESLLLQALLVRLAATEA